MRGKADDGCLDLWRHVLIRGLIDYNFNGTQYNLKGYKTVNFKAHEEARQWIDDNTDGFREVCLLAGFEASRVRKAVLEGTMDLEELLDERNYRDWCQ